MLPARRRNQTPLTVSAPTRKPKAGGPSQLPNHADASHQLLRHGCASRWLAVIQRSLPYSLPLIPVSATEWRCGTEYSCSQNERATQKSAVQQSHCRLCAKRADQCSHVRIRRAQTTPAHDIPRPQLTTGTIVVSAQNTCVVGGMRRGKAQPSHARSHGAPDGHAALPHRAAPRWLSRVQPEPSHSIVDETSAASALDPGAQSSARRTYRIDAIESTRGA